MAMSPELLTGIVLLVMGLAACALCSGVETGLYTINRVRLAVRVGLGERGALRIREELLRPNRMLATVLVGNNAAHYVQSSGATIFLETLGWSPTQMAIANAVLLTPVVFLLGELLPKDIFRAHTDRLTYATVWWVRFLRFVFTVVPLVPLVRGTGELVLWMLGVRPQDAATQRDRVGTLIREGAGSGVLGEEQLAVVDRALGMRGRPIIDHAVPWRKVVTVRMDADRGLRERTLREHAFSRFPVTSADGQVLGVLHALDVLIDPARPTSGLMRPALSLPPDAAVADAITAMRKARSTLAVIRGADGRPQGIVALRDLVQPIAGRLSGW
jgi:CBS domain containing-hemolysin-like protein